MLYSTVHGFDWWRTQQSWQTGLLGVKWWQVGVYLLGTSVRHDQLHLRRWREGSHQTWRCHCINDMLLAHRLQIPPARNHTKDHNKLIY